VPVINGNYQVNYIFNTFRLSRVIGYRNLQR